MKKFNIYIITSRPEKLLKDATYKWFKKNNIYYDKIIFMDEDCKYITAKNNGIELDYFVEDCLELAEKISKYIPVFVIKTPYNRNSSSST